MKRIKNEKTDLTSLFNDLDFDWHDVKSTNGENYWNPDAIYSFTSQEIDLVEDVTNELHSMCLDFVEHEIKSGDYRNYDFSELQKQLIEESWKNNHKSLYGRFDFHFNPETTELKMYEYNADTPTSLYEASIIQYETMYSKIESGKYDQFNSIHEELINTFKKDFADYKTIHFSALNDSTNEDYGNLNYILRCATEAGKNVFNIDIEDIGFQHETEKFKDLNYNVIECLFKLYPLEYFTTDDFSIHLLKNDNIRIVEPFWKLLLSNKLLMVKLWEKYKGHPNLLESYFGDNKFLKGTFIKKPLLSREGANVTKFTIENEYSKFTHLSGTQFNKDYDKSNYVIQRFVDQYKHDGKNVVIGSWVVGDKACGIGIREDYFDVIGNNSQFVPHIFN